MARKGSVISQADIAKAAGLSRMTVSYALRNDPKINAKTRQRIHELAKKLGYRPNPLVNSLMSHLRSGTASTAQASLAMVVASNDTKVVETNPTLKAILKGAQQQAEAAGFGLEVFQVGKGTLTAERLNTILHARGTVGAIFLASTPRILESFDFTPLANATYAYTMREPDLHRVCSFHFQLMQDAGWQLIERGYRKFTLVMNRGQDEHYHIFLGAYHALRQSYAPDQSADPIIIEDFNKLENVVHVLNEQGIDGVIVNLDTIGEELMEFIPDVPDKVGIVTLQRQNDSGFAGVNQNNLKIGSALVDLVVGQLHRNERGIPESAKTVLIHGDWIEGKTVRPLKN